MTTKTIFLNENDKAASEYVDIKLKRISHELERHNCLDVKHHFSHIHSLVNTVIVDLHTLEVKSLSITEEKLRREKLHQIQKLRCNYYEFHDFVMRTYK